MPKSPELKRLPLLSILFLYVLISACADTSDETSELINAESIKLNNIGVGQMGYFDYDSAFETFQQVHQQNPQWTLAEHNLIIATINRQQSGDETLAIDRLQSLLELNSNDLVAHYLLGILLYNQGNCDQAVVHFNDVLDQDDKDAYASYFLAQCQLQLNQIALAHKNFNTAIKQDPYLRSAYYGSFLTAQRLDKSEFAQQQLAAYSRLEMNPKAKLAEIKYTRMGTKAIAKTISNQTTEAQQQKPSQILSPFKAAKKLNISESQSAVTVVNTGMGAELLIPADNHILYVSYPDSQSQRKVALSGINQSAHISIGDFNNDNRYDLYITQDNQHDRIMLQLPKGESELFESIDLTLLKNTYSAQVRIFDADHDGDLDIVTISHEGKFKLLNNNGNLTFQDITAKVLESTDNEAIQGVAAVDVDGDRDLDLLLLKKSQLLVVENDRMWNYLTHANALSGFDLMHMGFADDGTVLLWLATRGQSLIKGFNISPDDFTPAAFSVINSNPVTQFAVTDVNADGIDELLIISAQQLQVIDSQSQATLQSLDFNDVIESFQLISAKQGPEMLLNTHNSRYQLAASEHRGPFMTLLFAGAQLVSDSMRSNSLGIGTEFVVFNQQLHKKLLFMQQSTLPQQGYQPINVASFGQAIDFIRLEWSDGVMQTELQLPAGQLHHIIEKQRQLSSCPVLFVKQGKEYQFITDVLGVGGMGFAIGLEQYAEPRPWENLVLTDYLNQDEAQFEFFITEPMEETAYIDHVELVAYDVPIGWQAVLDERMATDDNQPTGEVVYFKKSIKPVQVFDKQGEDVTHLNVDVDGQALPTGQIDRNFLGYLEAPQSHTFLLAEKLSGQVQLIINGWVEYGYSQTGFAAWQAGKVLSFPSLEIRVEGQWLKQSSEFGYPAGMPKYASIAVDSGEMSFDAIRLSTNQEVYFDQVTLAVIEDQPAVIEQKLPLLAAELQTIGYPKRTDAVNRFPGYDFSQRTPFWDTRYMTGSYTKLGPVMPLLSDADNALAIIAGGEGIQFSFKNNLAAVKAGYQRMFVIKFKGWAKDMDLLTQYGETVGPLPAEGTVTATAEELNQRYNVRYLSGQ